MFIRGNEIINPNVSPKMQSLWKTQDDFISAVKLEFGIFLDTE